MIDILREYRKIVICGPQRSGTTFCCKAIAEALDYEAVYEESFNTYDENKFLSLFSTENSQVIQAPGMTHLVHTIDDDLRVFVVIMRRSIEDIITSQNRISWNKAKKLLPGIALSEELIEKVKYASKISPEQYDIHFHKSIAEIKYDVWDNYQKLEIKNHYELAFSDLKTHFPESWVEKKQRQNFHPRQTIVDLSVDPVLNKYYTERTKYFGQLFFDTGSGYTEENSTRFSYKSDSFKISYDLSDIDGLKELRFDPLNDYAILHDLEMNIVTDKNEDQRIEPEFRHDGIKHGEASVLFNTNDPKIFIAVQEIEGLKRIEIKGSIEYGESVLRTLVDQRSHLENEADKGTGQQGDMMNHDSLRDFTTSLLKKNDALMSQRDRFMSKSNKLEKLIMDVKSKQRVQNYELNQTVKKAEALTQETERLRASFEQKSSKMELLLAEKNSLTAELEKELVRREEMNKLSNLLQKKIQELKISNEGYQTKLLSSEEQIKQAYINIGVLKTSKEEIKRLNRNLGSAQKRELKAVDKLKKSEGINAELTKAMKALQEDILELNSNQVASEQDYSRKISELEKQVEGFNTIKAELQQKTIANRNYIKKIKELQLQLGELNELKVQFKELFQTINE